MNPLKAESLMQSTKKLKTLIKSITIKSILKLILTFQNVCLAALLNLWS
jgi:hypothetical protein